jgi:hypothetical protein
MLDAIKEDTTDTTKPNAIKESTTDTTMSDAIKEVTTDTTKLPSKKLLLRLHYQYLQTVYHSLLTMIPFYS